MDSQKSWQSFDLRCPRRGRSVLLFILLAMPLSATTYYVDCSGSDSNNGTSTTTAWQTIAKVNDSFFSPGDKVLFKAGCTWREQLSVPSSGVAGHPITFSAYGMGPSPIISGADLLTSWTTFGGLYCSSAATQPTQVFVNGQRLTSVDAKSSLVTGAWWWDSANRRVCSFDSPSGHTIEASQRDYGFYAGNKSYLTISNLETDAANRYGTFCNSCTGLLATAITASKNADTGLRVDSNTSAIVSYSTAAYNGGNGFAGFASPSLLFDHLTAHHNSWDTNKTDTAGINLTDTSTGYWPGTAKTATNVIVQYSESYDNGVAVCCSHGVGIWADTIGDGFIVRYNYVHDNNGVGIYAEKDSGVIVHHNIVVSNRGVLGDVLGGIVLYMDCASIGCSIRDSLVANNVVYDNYGHGIRLLAQSITNDCINNRVVNNISTGNNGDQLDAEYGCENVTYGSGNVYAYNSLGVAGSTSIQWGRGSTYSTYSSWESARGNCASDGCSHSIQSDPLFTNVAGRDFTLQDTSPAIKAGVALGSSYQTGLDPRTSFPWTTLDQGQGSGTEAGAFVFLTNGAPAAPTGLTATVN